MVSSENWISSVCDARFCKNRKKDLKRITPESENQLVTAAQRELHR